jgi:WD40 repeat protein
MKGRKEGRMKKTIMQKSITWSGQQLLVSNGNACSLLHPEAECSRDFETEGVSALSPDGSLVVTCECDDVVRVRRVIRREWRIGDVLFSCQKLSPAAVLGFAWSANAGLLAVQQADGATHTYQLQPDRQGRPGRHLKTCSLALPGAMAFAPRGNRLALADAAGVVLWDARSGDRLRTVGQGRVRSVAWGQDGRYLALGGSDSTVGIYLSGRPRRPVRTWTGHTAAVTSLAWSPDGQCIASGDQDGNVLYWDTRGDVGTWKPLSSEDVPMRCGVNALAWSPDGNQVAVVDDLDQLDVFEVQHHAVPVLAR